MLSTDKELLLDLKRKADNYKKSADTNSQFSISNEQLVLWHKRTIELANKLIAIEDLIENQNLQKFKSYQSSLIDPYLYATKIKRDIKKVLNLFYSLFLFMHKKLFGKPYGGNLPDIIQ